MKWLAWLRQLKNLKKCSNRGFKEFMINMKCKTGIISRKFSGRILLLFFLFFFVNHAGIFAQHHQESKHDEAHAEEDKFSPKNFIFDHLGDAYEWHILTYHDFHLSVPLPVILYSKSSGLHVFFSSKFHHGHDTYKNFKIAQKGDFKGKIVEINENGDYVRPIDLSITKNVVAIFFSVFLLFIVFINIAKRYKAKPCKAPSGIQSFFEPIILFVRDDIAKPSIGEDKHEQFMPYLLSIFFFIWFNNMLGLVPIFPAGANVTGNITVTLALALFTFLMTNLSGNKHYWKEIFNAPGIPWWLKVPIPLLPVIEILGMVIKPFTLMIRLFANITAGHIIALSFFALIFIFGEMKPVIGYGSSVLSIAFTVFMTFLEFLVALIQAYVFTLLSALYFGMAKAEHH